MIDLYLRADQNRYDHGCIFRRICYCLYLLLAQPFLRRLCGSRLAPSLSSEVRCCPAMAISIDYICSLRWLMRVIPLLIPSGSLIFSLSILRLTIPLLQQFILVAMFIDFLVVPRAGVELLGPLISVDWASLGLLPPRIAAIDKSCQSHKSSRVVSSGASCQSCVASALWCVAPVVSKPWLVASQAPSLARNHDQSNLLQQIRYPGG